MCCENKVNRKLSFIEHFSIEHLEWYLLWSDYKHLFVVIIISDLEHKTEVYIKEWIPTSSLVSFTRGHDCCNVHTDTGNTAFMLQSNDNDMTQSTLLCIYDHSLNTPLLSTLLETLTHSHFTEWGDDEGTFWVNAKIWSDLHWFIHASSIIASFCYWVFLKHYDNQFFFGIIWR